MPITLFFVFIVSKNENRPHHSWRGGAIWFGDRILSAE